MKILLANVSEPFQVVEVENELEPIQKIVGGYIEVLPVTEDILLIMNEEGKLFGLPSNFQLIVNQRVADTIAGNALFVGRKEEDFSSLTDAQIDKIKQMFENRNKMILR